MTSESLFLSALSNPRMPLIQLNSVFQPEGVDCIPVIVDLVSLGLVKGEMTCSQSRPPIATPETSCQGTRR
jgi:hypothetical protein